MTSRAALAKSRWGLPPQPPDLLLETVCFAKALRSGLSGRCIFNAVFVIVTKLAQWTGLLTCNSTQDETSTNGTGVIGAIDVTKNAHSSRILIRNSVHVKTCTRHLFGTHHSMLLQYSKPVSADCSVDVDTATELKAQQCWFRQIFAATYFCSESIKD